MRAGGSAPAFGTDKGNILGRSGRRAEGARGTVEGRAGERAGRAGRASATLLMLRVLSRSESRNGGCDLKMTTLGNEAYVQSNISRFVMT